MNPSYSKKYSNRDDEEKYQRKGREQGDMYFDPDWKSLNMRVPGGASVLDLQRISHKGYLVQPQISQGYFDPHQVEEKFSEDEIQAFKEAFVFFDREGDGTINLEDLGLALRSLGFIVTNSEVEELRNKYDPDGRREVIDLRDFLSCVVDVGNKIDGPEVILQSFSALDKEETGLISIEEFRHVMTNLGDTLSNEEVNAILKELDIYGDQMIRINDLVNLLNIKR